MRRKDLDKFFFSWFFVGRLVALVKGGFSEGIRRW